ncbi:MAG: two-component system response regulator CreB [Steroidobacteraceae bacterium]
MPTILIIEDEAAIADTLLFALQAEGFAAIWKSLAGEGLDYLRQHAVDLVVLDVGLPDISGFEACRQLRRFSDIPVLFLTARGAEVDRIVGLEIGADDYVVKPFSPREVAVRVRAILKRTRREEATSITATHVDIKAVGAFRVDAERLQIHYHNQALNLTRAEFRLLQSLLAQPQRVLSREQLLAAMGIALEAGYERNIDGHIKSLRAKLRQINATGEPIQTHRGFGYSYQPEQG